MTLRTDLATVLRLLNRAAMLLIALSDRRHHLTPDIIEMIESLKSWRKMKGVAQIIYKEVGSVTV